MPWVCETKIDKHQGWPKTSKHMLETLTLSMLLQIYVTLRLLEAVSPATEPLSSKQLWSADERAENQRQLQAAAICSADCWVRLVPLCRRPSGGTYAHGSPRVSQTFLQKQFSILRVTIYKCSKLSKNLAIESHSHNLLPRGCSRHGRSSKYRAIGRTVSPKVRAVHNSPAGITMKYLGHF